jgi:hypothetical protein
MWTPNSKLSNQFKPSSGPGVWRPSLNGSLIYLVAQCSESLYWMATTNMNLDVPIQASFAGSVGWEQPRTQTGWNPMCSQPMQAKKKGEHFSPITQTPSLNQLMITCEKGEPLGTPATQYYVHLPGCAKEYRWKTKSVDRCKPPSFHWAVQPFELCKYITPPKKKYKLLWAKWVCKQAS